MDTAAIAALTANGFEEKEARVYLALLGLGEAPVTDVAVRAGLKRGITYVVLGRLMERGFVSEASSRAVRRFRAADPDKVATNVSANVLALKQFLPALRAMQVSSGGRPYFEAFEGHAGVVSVYRQFELGKEARYFASMARHEEHFRDEVERWIRGYESGAYPTVGKNLVVGDAAGRRFAERLRTSAQQAVRFLPEGQDVDMDLAIVDDRIGITNFDPLSIVVVHSDRLARSMSVLFDFAWAHARAPRVGGARKQR